MNRQLIFSCEHASSAIPAPYQDLFIGQDELLATHEGYDIGAHELTMGFLKHYDVPHCIGKHSRLLIDLNRTINHPKCFSRFTQSLPKSVKQDIHQNHYLPYINQLSDHIQQHVSDGKEVIHLSIHSFTPVLNNQVRRADIGILYDPKRPSEKLFTKQLKQALSVTDYHIRMNYPYRGTSNSLVTYFRSQYAAESYQGIEIEVNQKLLVTPEKDKVFSALLSAFREVMST